MRFTQGVRTLTENGPTWLDLVTVVMLGQRLSRATIAPECEIDKTFV